MAEPRNNNLLSIATYNLRKGGAQRQHWVRLLEDHDVDLLLTQESYAPTEHLPLDRYPHQAQQTAWQPASRHAWGCGIFSRSGTVTPFPVPGFRGWLVGAEISGASWQRQFTDALLVFSLHVPAGPGSYWGQLERMLNVIRRRARDRPFILGGDFNILVSPQSGVDRPAGKRDRAIQARLVDECGLLNCWHAANPELPPCQTLRWTGAPSVPYHCDGIFVPKLWTDRLTSCHVLSGPEWNALSDHNPMVARFHTK